MAKHPHRLMLFNKKTWKCTLPGCAYFVHLGLVHLLLGKRAVCWECGEEFTVDTDALRDDMPKCFDCRSPVPEVTEEAKDELDPKIRKIYEDLGLLKKEKK